MATPPPPGTRSDPGSAASVAPGLRLLPGTDLSVSRLGLGTHGLHWLGGSARQSLLSLAFEAGVRCFDTAPCYGEGLAEEALGRFAAARRSEVVLTTKFGIPANRLLSRVPGLFLAARAAGAVLRKLGAAKMVRDYSAAGARRSVEQSLRALRTDHIDVLYLHEPTLALLEQTEVSALLSTLAALRQAGKVRYIGLSGAVEACGAIAAAYPELAQVQQLEVPADAQGLPQAGAPVNAAVRFWEFPGQAPLAQVMARLQRVAPQGVILLSTRDAMQLREAAALIGDPSLAPVDAQHAA